MQSVADLRLFQIAEPGVELGQIAVLIAGEAGVEVDPRGGGQRQDLAPQMGDAAGIDAGSLVIFIDQRFEIAQRTVAFRACQRRGEVVDDDRLCPTFGLRAFAGVIDDKGIDMGNGAEDRLGQAGVGKGDGLTGQPFEIAVLAHVDQRVRREMFTQVDVKCEVVVRRRQVGGVVGLLWVDIVSAGGLHADHRVAVLVDGELETAGPMGGLGCLRRGCLGQEEGVVLGLAPSVGDLLFDRPGQGVKVREIGGKRERRTALGLRPVGQVVGRAGEDLRHQRVAVGGNVVERIARLVQQVEHMDRRRRRVEADAIGEATVLVWVIGEDQSDLALRRFRAAQNGPVPRQLRDKVDAVATGLPSGDRAFGRRVEKGFALEGDGPRQDAAIDLR